MIYIAYFILLISFINLFRMVAFLIISDIYDIAKLNKVNSNDRFFSNKYKPLVTIIVPAHNEQRTLKRNLFSILNSTYKNIELIIVNDSSTDKTKSIALNFQRKYKKNFNRIKVLNVNVRGKAKALNSGLKYATGSLFMCLDSDSALTSRALEEAVSSFRDKSLAALSSNVKIFPGKGLLNFIQRIEYLVCYQMKKAETATKVQYIIGGIGSMYRTRYLRALNYYETDTITEDIDLSMKLLQKYGKAKHIGYNPSVVVFTEAVLTISDLLKQRYRWKYGRYQVFLKRSNMFCSLGKKHNFLLSWIYLPYALFSEITYILEPLTVLFILYLIFRFGDFTMLIGAICTFCFYTIIQVSGACQSYSKKERILFSLLSPVAFFLMYILSYVEYMATVKGFRNLRKLIINHKTGTGSCEWTHVARSGAATVSKI